MRCPDARDALLETLTGRTPPERRRAVAAHLVECAACREEAVVLEEAVLFLRAVPDPAPPAGFWPQFMTRLEARRQQEAGGLRARVRRLLPARRGLVPAAATVAVVLLLAVTSTLLRPPAPAAISPQTQVAPYLTESMRTLLPQLEETVLIWQAGLGAREAEPLLEPSRP